MPEFNDAFLRACRREPAPRTPIWLMRQAGRYQPEYRELRRQHSMAEICAEPDLAVEVTLMPLRRFDFDAAILFSDLTVPFADMGVPFSLKESVGPVIESPVRTRSDVSKLTLIEPEECLPAPLKAIRLLRRQLHVPLIGFTGAPFTWAAYMVEGQGSRDYKATRTLMYSDPPTWHALMELLAENAYRYLRAQIEAGAQAVQLFDSWVGILSPSLYRECVLPHMRPIFERLKPLGVPVIHFGTGTASLLEAMKEAGGDVIGVDWRVSLKEARARLGDDVAVQGNLDPVVLLGPADGVEREACRVLREAGDTPGYIFNLGHGVLPDTPVENVQLLVEVVHGGVS
jgi:uroporphyrinogen decarboxylase